MNDNIQKLYGALQKYGYGDLGTADEFGAKVQDDNNRRKLYDALSRDGFSDLGSYEEFSGRLMQGGPAQETAQPAAPAQEQSAPAAPAVDRAEQKRNAEEGRAMFDRMRESRRPATSPVPVQPQAGQAQEPAQSEEPAPAPAETASSANAKADEKEQLKKKMADLEQVLEAVRGDADFADEYEGRKSERDRRAKELGSLRGDIRGSGFDPSQLDEDNRYISENESRYGNAVEDRKAARQVQADIDALKGRILQIEGEESKKRIDAKRKDINMRVPGTGRNAVTMGPGGFASYPEDLNEMKDSANYFAADQILGMADQQWSQGSKNDEGYKGNDLEKLWTAVSQFASGAAKEVDLGTFTLGLSEGSALMAARKVGEKYNGLINSAIKDMKMSDGDMDMLMSHLDANGRKLEDLGAELDRAGAELETMKSTYEDLVNRGDPKARAYGREYQKKVDAYNKLINEEYRPLRAEYENDRAAYQKVMEAVDSAVQNGLSDSERAVLDALDEFTNAKAARAEDASTASKAGAGFEQSLEFMLDFLLTRGVGKAGTKAATKIAKNRMLKKVGAEALKDMTVKPGLGLRMATDAASAAVRTAVMVPRNLKAYGDQLAEYTGKDELGRINFDRSRLDAALNTAVTQYIEYWSEGFGEYFGEAEQALFRNVTKAAPKTAIGQTLKNYRGSIGKYLDYGKFDGMFNEMMEEVVGSTFNSLSGWLSNDRVGDKDALKDFFAGENLATMALSFLPMSAIGAVTNLSAYHKMKNRYDEGVKMLSGFVNSGILEREEVEALTANISDMTPEQIKGNIVKLADKARERNGGALPSDFAKNMLGYVEGSFAMDLRHDEWEDSQEKMAVVGAYTESYSRPDVSFAWDADQAEAEAKSAALAAGFTEEDLDADPFILGQDAASLRDTEPERSQALSDYAVAKARSEGLRNGFMDSVDRDAEEYGDRVRQNLDRDGIVVMANMNENGNQVPVFVMSTDAIIGQYGKVTTPTGEDGLVTIRRGEEAEPETVKASELSGADVQMTDVFVTEQVDAIKARANEFYEAARKAVSPAGQQRMLEQRVGTNVVVSGDGAFMPVRVERMKADEGKVVISGDKEAIKAIATATNTQSAGGTMLEVNVADLWPHLSREEDGSLTTFEQEARTEAGAEQEQPQQAPAKATQVNPDELQDTERTVMIGGKPTKVKVNTVGGDGVWFTYKDEKGVERESDMPLDTFMASLVDEQAPAPAAEAQAPAQAPASSFPVDEKTGKRVFDHPSVTPEQAYRELMNGVAPGSKNEANRRKFIESSTAKAANALAEAQNKIAGLQARRDAVDEWEIGEDEDIDAFEARQNEKRAEIDAEIAEVEAQVPELQRKAAHWAAVRDMAGAVSSERKDARLTDKVAEWSKRTGVKARVFRSPDEIDDKTVKDAIAQGERVGGWYNPKTGEVGLYLPNLADEAEVAKTFIHEVVSHKGLRDLLGKENYDSLCDKVWDQLMSEEDRQKYLDYNSHLKGSEEFLRRAAADEWIAHFSETLGLEENRNLFDKFVDFVKEFLDRILGEDAKISKDDLANLLRSSLARYESERKSTAEAKPLSMESLPADIQAELREKGEVMDGGAVMDDLQDKLKKETGYKTPNELDMESDPVVGDVRMSKTTIPAWAANYMTYPEAREHVVKVLENLTDRMAADELVNGVIPQGTYKYGEKSSGGFAGPLRTNIEYVVTFDMDTSCPRSLQYLEYVKQIEAQIGRPLTQRESIQLIEMMRMYGQMIPCVYCYCENKRQALKQYYTDFMTSRHAVISAKTDEEALEHMYGHATNKAAKESKDPAVVLNKAAYKVFQQWRKEREYNPTLRQLWAQYHNDRNVVLTVLDSMLDNGSISTNMTDEKVSDALCSYLGITDKNAQGAVGDIISEWKWNRIEDRPHDDYTPILDEDELVVDNRTLALWREMTLYGKSASSAKNVMRYVPYTDELKTLSQEQKDYINGMGGLRMHSSNDFRIDYVLDYFQFMADMEVNHMFGHTYTKSPEFVRIFGNSGYKINMSIAAYEDSYGIRPNPQEGFDWTTAKELREKFPNAGTMLMATSDAQIQMALDSDWIDMFIPFHHSGLPKAVWYDMRHWDDYTAKQNEKFLNGEEMREALAADGVDVPKKAGAAEVEKMYNEHFHIRVETYKTGKDKGKRIRPHFLPGKTVVDGVEIPGHNNDYNRYIELCREWGVHPRFYGIKVKDNTPEGGGREVDITEHPAYMKCIKETARTDTPQTAIQFNFDQPSEALGGRTPIDYAMAELWTQANKVKEQTGSPARNIYELYKKDIAGIVPMFINDIIKHGEEVKKRTGKDLPLDYLTPDSRRWFMTERNALESAYKDFDTIPYHPHEYDADGNLIMEPEAPSEKDNGPVAEDGSWTVLRKVEDPAVVEWFNNAPKKTGFRTVAKIGEGEYGSPMAGQLGRTKGKGAVSTSSFGMNEIEQSEENPDIADENGKVKLIKPKREGVKLTDVGSVDYNPYIHLRLDKINRQFKDAWKRDDLVYIESEVPEEEVPDFRGEKEPDFSKSPYHADKAKLPVGIHDWNGGALMLSRYDRPFREVPWEEVADAWAADKDFQENGVHFDIVPPQIRQMLVDRGIEIIPPHKGMGQDCIDAYNAWKNGGNGPDGGTRFRKANESQLGLVSNAGAALDRIKMEKATPEQWVKMLEKEGGLKAGEDKWLGLSDWLKGLDRKTVTKDEIDDYIAEHRIQIEEVKYSESGENDRDAMEQKHPGFWNAYSIDTNWRGETGVDQIQDVAIAVDLYNRDHEDKIVPYDTGRDGRPVLTEEDYDKLMDYGDEMLNELHHINPTRLNYTTDGLDNKREIALTVPTIEPWNQGDNIHFGDAGEGRAVAWARFGETTDEDGKRVLVIDEIQSKRHQEAREQGGYRDDTLIKRAEAKMDAAKDEYDNYVQGLVEKYGGFNEMRSKLTPEENAESNRLYSVYQNARTVFNRNGFDPNEDEEYRRLRAEQQAHENSPEFQQLMKDWTAAMKAGDTDRVAEIQKQLNPFQLENQRLIHKIEDREVELADEFNETHKSKVAAAPFEKNWHELAMKRMLRLAAEEGYDYVAWTTGDQQAERYNIGSVVKKVSAGMDQEGKRHTMLNVDANGMSGITILTHDDDGNITGVSGSNTELFADAKNLADVVGKEMAADILTISEPGSANMKEYKGKDLRIGGEGMKGFYDEILPRFMNKYGKKWGVKVQDITLPFVEEAGRVMHAVPVTQEMKESVMEGQTMFRKAPNGKQSNLTDDQWKMVRTPEFKAWFGDWENDPANASKVVDENGEPLVVYHGTRYGGFNQFDTGNERWPRGAYFTRNEKSAQGYANYDDPEYDESELDRMVYPVFLNVKNPLMVDSNGGANVGDIRIHIREINDMSGHAKAIIDAGYDGVIALQGHNEMTVVFSPNQIKSATDNNGQFDKNNPDIRFRITPEQDAEYMDAVNAGDMEKAQQMVRDAFKAAFPNTKVRRVVYHGTHAEDGERPFNTFESGHFTDEKSFAQYYADAGGNGYVFDTFLNMENPYVYDFKGQNSDFATDDDGNRINTYSIHQWAIENGYDGVVLLNVDEYGDGVEEEDDGYYPNTVTDYIPKSPNQVKSAAAVERDDAGNVIPLSKRFNPENDDIRFRIDTDSQELFDAAKERFGTTRDIREAGYVLPDGTMLDFSGRHWTSGGDNSWLNGMRQVDHREISDLEFERDGNTPTGIETDMSDFIRRGAIRISYPGTINLYTKPTWEQESVLERLIRMNNKFVRVDFGDGARTEHYADYDYASPAKVIDDIYGYFDDGIKPDGSTRFRRSMSEEDIQNEARIAQAERIVTGKMLDSMPEAIGAGVQRVSRNDMPAGHKTDKGYYNPETNTVSVCMDNVLDERDAVATVIHETVGRKGLEDLFGERYHDAMASSYAALDAEGRTWVNAYILRNGLKPGDGGILRGMEEYMARLAARDGGPVLDAINDILSEAVDFSVGTEGFRFTDRELAYTLLASYEHSKNPNWLDTPAGKAQDTLWKREYGINESDPNRPTDPDGPDAGTRFRRGAGDAVDRYEERMKDWKTIAMMEIQNADIPVKAGYEEILKEKFGDQWEKRMKGLRSDEDYLMRHNLSSSRADTENHNFKLFHFDPMIEKVREVQRKLVGKNAGQQKLQDAYERVLDYLYAVSGLERNEWERNNGGEAKDWSGLTSLMGRPKEEWKEAEADARAMVDAFKAEVGDDALLDQLWDAIRSCTDFSLDHAYKYGLITKADYERLRGANGKPRLWNYYLPLRGFTQRTAEEEFDYAGIIGNRSQNDEVVKEAKGRWTEADNPLAYIANIAQKEIVQGNENWARQALLRFVRNVGENSLLSERKPWYVKSAGPKGGAVWTLAEPWDIDPSTGKPETIEHFEERMQGLKKTGDARQGRKGLELGLVMANQGHRNQHLIHVKVGGEDRMIWVNGNPALARAVSGAGKEPNYEMWRKASRVISNTFTTYSLDFTAKNLLRDSIYSLLGQMVKEDRKYMARYFTNWLGNGGFTAAPMIRLAALWDSGELQRKDPSKLTRKERMFIDFMHDGGQTGYTIVRNVEKMKKAIEKTLAPSTLSRVVDGAKFKVAGVDVPVLGIYTWGVRTLNEAFELLTRFTAYETSRDMGRDGQRSAYDAKEISVNFNRRGAQSNKGFWGHVAAYFGGTHYFFNAGIQGFDNFLRLYKTNPKAFGIESAAIMALGFFTPLINALISGGGDGDDDKEKFNWYWNLPEWVRRNNIVLGYDNKYLAIPLPVEFRALYGLGDITNSVFLSHTYPNPFPGNMFLDIVSTASGILPVNPIEGYNGKSVDLKDAVLRSVVPDLTIFFVDWVTNQDYTGRQLKKENMFTPNVPKSQGAYASTPKALVEACQWMGEHFGVDMAPGVVRDFLSNYGGGFYKFAEDLSKRMFTDDDHPKRWDDIPFLSGFTGHIDEDRTVTYVNGILNEYKDLADGIVTKMNLYSNSSDIKGKQAFVDTDELPQKAKVQALLSGKDYRIAQAYYKGMEDEHTGQKGRVRKTYKTGKRAGKSYTTTQEIVIPGVNSKKKAWKEAREKWSSLPDGSQEKAQAYADVTNAWHEYYNAAADLAQLLMDMEYGKIEFE